MKFFNQNIKMYNEKFQQYVDGITDPKMKQNSLYKLSTYCLACAYSDLPPMDQPAEPSKESNEHTEYAIKYLDQILSIDETKRPLISRKLGTYYQGYIFFKPDPNETQHPGCKSL